jgi:hypothetical protein
MWTFLIAGVVYLIGIAVILTFRPEYMFTPDGLWKEFGIEKGNEYTLCPFWLFCILWAVISYFLVIVFYTEDDVLESVQRSVDLSQPVELPKGYYVLNNKATRLAGVPKYVYLGEDGPNMS